MKLVLVIAFVLICWFLIVAQVGRAVSYEPQGILIPVMEGSKRDTGYVKTSYNECWLFDGEFKHVDIKHCKE